MKKKSYIVPKSTSIEICAAEIIAASGGRSMSFSNGGRYADESEGILSKERNFFDDED